MSKPSTKITYQAVFVAANAALCTLLFVFATALLLPQPSGEALEQIKALNRKLPFLTGWRDESGVFFGQDRINAAPVHYGWLHVFPAMVWCAFIPLQHVDSIRQRYPAAHRWMGRAALTANLVLCGSGLMLAPRRLSYTHARTFHLHGGVMPTFEVATTLVAAAQLVTIAQTYRTARTRKWQRHRIWARRHTVAGAVISLQRVAMVIITAVGVLLATLPKEVQQQWFAVPEDPSDVWAGERAAMAASAWMGEAAGLAWLYYDERHRWAPLVASSAKKAK